jgi:hypothetical protein
VRRGDASPWGSGLSTCAASPPTVPARMRRRRAFRGWVLSLAAASAAGCVARPELGGPLPVRNQHPAQLTVLQLPAARSEVLPAGRIAARLDSAYSSLFLLGQEPDRTWVMDGEYLRVGCGLRAGLGGGFELGGELPFAHTSGGFLDSFVIDYHDALGLPDQSRDANPKDAFEIEALRDGVRTWAVERDSLELLDVPLHVTRTLLPAGPERLGVAVRGGLELPTGDDERGYGSGGVDWLLGALAEFQVAGLGCYAHAQHTWVSTPAIAARDGLEFADVLAWGLALEAPLTQDLHALAQVTWETSTLRHFGLNATSREQVLLWIGGRWHPAPELGIEVGFGEDLQGLASPDFTAWLGFVWLPGAGGGAAARP